MMRKLKSLIRWVASSAAAMALMLSLASVASACFFTAYQPDVPDELL